MDHDEAREGPYTTGRTKGRVKRRSRLRDTPNKEMKLRERGERAFPQRRGGLETIIKRTPKKQKKKNSERPSRNKLSHEAWTGSETESDLPPEKHACVPMKSASSHTWKAQLFETSENWTYFSLEGKRGLVPESMWYGLGA